MKSSYHWSVKKWLIAGCVLLFFQVVIGGITRITGSGLSITDWDIVTGTLPPMNTAEWDEAFDLYKATPQYEKINEGMSMKEFKFIYFWEYFHRLWARMMGFIFLFPFLFFCFRKMIDRRLMKYIILMIISAMLAASMGWIMVASGLIDRPWVNAYKLSFHLCIAFLTFSFLIWATYIAHYPEKAVENPFSRFKPYAISLIVLLAIQLFLGGVMSGMRAGLVYPTWPDMNGELIPKIMWNSEMWIVDNFNNYERSAIAPALFHVLHRGMAYILACYVLFYAYRIRKSIDSPIIKRATLLLVGVLLLQVIIGILTVVNCKGTIPLFYGVMHQAVAMVLLATVLWNHFLLKRGL